MKPILHQIQSFDANGRYEFTYTCEDVDIESAEIVIRENASMAIVHVCKPNGQNELVYPDDKVTSNTKLRNGVRYNAIVTVTYKTPNNTHVTESSNVEQFICTTPPTLTFYRGEQELSKTEPNEIDTTTLTVRLEYDQAELELIHNYTVSLYDKAKVPIWSNAETGDYEDHYGFGDTYTFPTLENLNTYYIRAYGSTQRGLLVDTGMIKIVVKAQAAKNYATIYLNNNERYGYVDYSTNLVIIQPDVRSSNYTFVGGSIDLRDNDKLVEYSKGFSIGNDFVLWLRGRGFSELLRNHHESIYATPEDCEHRLLTINNGVSVVTLEVHPYDEELYRFALTVNDTPDEKEHPLIRCAFSQPYAIDNDDVFLICIKNHKGAWGVYATLESRAEHLPNYWIGNIKPTQNVKEGDIWLDVGAVEINGQQEPDSITYVLADDMSVLFDLADSNGEDEYTLRDKINREVESENNRRLINGLDLITDEEKEEIFNQRFEQLCQRIGDSYNFKPNSVWVDGR